MSAEFQREYLLRLPLPLAQLYSRAHNAKAQLYNLRSQILKERARHPAP
jgi:hypothetical protein